jgi:hypothetical protein
MNTIKYLKPDSAGKQKIKLNGITYRPYTVCELPANFGCINFNEKEGISEWFNYKGFTYLFEKMAKFSQSDESLIARHKTKLSSEFSSKS